MEERGKKVSKTEKHAIFFLAENEAKCQIFGGYFCIMTNFLWLIWYVIKDPTSLPPKSSLIPAFYKISAHDCLAWHDFFCKI